jgi:3-dehydroshikimate dehydratase
MIRLSAFADEISPDLNEQIAVLKSENIHFLDLRGVWNTNVLDLSDKQANEVKETLDAHGIGVAAIGSPIGKVPIDSPFDEHLQRFEGAIALAKFFQTPFMRIFSFYPGLPEADKSAVGTINRPLHPAAGRDEVLRRLREMTARARAAGIILLHENEKDIYGDTIARCVDLLQSCDDAHMQAVFDPANFIQCGQTPYPDAYEALRPWLRCMHVKDARADGSVVAAGEGMARWPELLQRLREDGYDGFFSLEPHLAAAGRYQGFSGPDLFRRASQALQGMLQTMGWEYA